MNSDVESPEIFSCPNDVTYETDPGLSTAVVNWTFPAITDNSGEFTSSVDHAPGTAFALGVTNVTVTAVDTSGNIANCLFSITVIGKFTEIY